MSASLELEQRVRERAGAAVQRETAPQQPEPWRPTPGAVLSGAVLGFSEHEHRLNPHVVARDPRWTPAATQVQIADEATKKVYALPLDPGDHLQLLVGLASPAIEAGERLVVAMVAPVREQRSRVNPEAGIDRYAIVLPERGEAGQVVDPAPLDAPCGRPPWQAWWNAVRGAEAAAVTRRNLEVHYTVLGRRLREQLDEIERQRAANRDDELRDEERIAAAVADLRAVGLGHIVDGVTGHADTHPTSTNPEPAPKPTDEFATLALGHELAALEAICAHAPCGERFIPATPQQRYHADKCRVAAFRARQATSEAYE